MKIYGEQNVFDAAMDRMRYIFDEFDDVVVSVSGGKDSTVIYQLALMVAEEKNRTPIKVLFIDQEAEWGCVISYMRSIMTDVRVDPYWFQMPLKIFNATSTIEPWLYCWEDGKEWMREKENYAKTINKYGTDRFKKLFPAIFSVEFKAKKTCGLRGVRCEESPGRAISQTGLLAYKNITWGNSLSKKRDWHVALDPIYDWSVYDVWKAIHDNDWPYCPIYDYMYQYGVPLREMRVSNVHHETAVKSLFFLQEIESDTWDSLTKRIGGIATAGRLGSKDFSIGQDLPFMFDSWFEYRDYLLENLITDTTIRARFKKKFDYMDRDYGGIDDPSILYRLCINTLVCNDFEFTKLANFIVGPNAASYRKWKRDGVHGKYDALYRKAARSV
jgi:predicted phosphoadenosine phosphosulfate sulfurtransferase